MWFRKQKGAETAVGSVSIQHPKTTPLLYSPITLEHWQKSPEHRQYAVDLFQQAKFRELMSVLHNSRPSVVVTNCQPTEAAVLLGIRQGFDMLLGVIPQLQEQPFVPQEEVEPTYGAEEFDINKT